MSNNKGCGTDIFMFICLFGIGVMLIYLAISGFLKHRDIMNNGVVVKYPVSRVEHYGYDEDEEIDYYVEIDLDSVIIERKLALDPMWGYSVGDFIEVAHYVGKYDYIIPKPGLGRYIYFFMFLALGALLIIWGVFYFFLDR